MLTRAALKNPYAVFALCMIALILGGVSYQKMRVDIFPEIELPSILVTTFYRGLSPSEMEGAITFGWSNGSWKRVTSNTSNRNRSPG